ncbi:MAG: DinB family protein [Sporocytophaga sp.]|uniref:DinB family protein n=1 Tax=Sporocytophaga sp. TaxID=2231183 RepID=UPI001B25646E|nr:DinB family protein [Sporocytophaga sp.]MBO9701424.1 DinB family protein [Sporocytophaga sp.]
MKNAAELIEELNNSTNMLTNKINQFKDNDFNVKPEPNQWSAGDVAEHIYILESFINKVLVGTCISTERNPEEKILVVKNIFSNFDKKLNAPDPIAPSVNIKTIDQLLNDIKTSRLITEQIVSAHDLSLICKDFVHKGFGEMTRTEWVHFCIYHTERHLHQMQKIKEKISA